MSDTEEIRKFSVSVEEVGKNGITTENAYDCMIGTFLPGIINYLKDSGFNVKYVLDQSSIQPAIAMFDLTVKFSEDNRSTLKDAKDSMGIREARTYQSKQDIQVKKDFEMKLESSISILKANG